MLNKLLYSDPPHPQIPKASGVKKSLPKELSPFQDIDFTIASSKEEIIHCFQKLITYLNRESPKNNINLIRFIFSSLVDRMFPFYLKSGLADCVNKIMSELRNEFSNQIDDLLYLFLSRLTRSIIKALNEPAILNLQTLVIKAKLRQSGDLLRAMYASNRFIGWIQSKNRTGPSLQIILNAIYPANIQELPLPLASEIARCLIISSLYLDKLDYFDIENTKFLLVSCISRFLRYKPESFANPSIIACLREITTKKVIAPPLYVIKNHPKLVEIPNILQSVRFWLFIIGTYNPDKLLEIASISPALQSDVLNYHFQLFENIPQSLNFFKQSLVIDGVCNLIGFADIPNNIHDLALFLRNRANDAIKFPVFTKMLGQIISNIYHQIKSLPLCSCDVSLMISSAKVICSLMTFVQTAHQKDIPSGFDPLSPHYFETACAIAEAMVFSPLYPHYPTDNCISTLLKAAFDELAGTCATKPKEFLSYLLNVRSNPAKCLLFTCGLNSPIVIEHHKNTWRHYIINNLSGILKMGLSLLKAPSNITIDIVSSFYITIVKFSMKIIRDFPQKLLYGILNAPIILFNSVAEIALQTEPIRMGNDKSEEEEEEEESESINRKVGSYGNCSVILSFLGFIEKIIENKYVKCFFNVNAGPIFWNQILTFISPPFTAISAQLASRAFRIIARLSDYSNTINPLISPGQRILVDTIHYNDLLEIIQMINNMTDCKYNTKMEKGILSLSIAELLAAWCSPRPIAEVVKANLDLENLFEKLKFFACDAGENFDMLVSGILKEVESCMNSVCETDALKDIIEIEGNLPKFLSSKKLTEMYFKIAQPSSLG